VKRKPDSLPRTRPEAEYGKKEGVLSVRGPVKKRLNMIKPKSQKEKYDHNNQGITNQPAGCVDGKC